MSFVNQDLQKLQNNIITNWNKNRADLQLKFCSVFFTFNVFFLLILKANPNLLVIFAKKLNYLLFFLWIFGIMIIQTFAHSVCLSWKIKFLRMANLIQQ